MQFFTGVFTQYGRRVSRVRVRVSVKIRVRFRFICVGDGWSKKRRHDETDDGTPLGRYATGHCPVVVYVRRTHDGTLARGVVQETGQTMRHV